MKKRKRLRCNKCKALVLTAIGEPGEIAYCKCQRDLDADYNDELWESEEVDE